jgi:hypothetical protein
MTGPLAARLGGVAMLLAGVGAVAFAGYVAVVSSEFDQPLAVVALLLVTALVAFWQARVRLGGD